MQNHWVLVVFDLPSRTISIFNPLASVPMEAQCSRARDIGEVLLKAPGVQDSYKPWNHPELCTTPQQGNTVDCGIYVIAVALLVMAGSEPMPTSINSRVWRKLLASSLNERSHEELKFRISQLFADILPSSMLTATNGLQSLDRLNMDITFTVGHRLRTPLM
jgi:Ulp1 family protease